MPSLPPVNAVISRIDAPFPEQWRAPLNDFKKELQAIQSTLGVMSVLQKESFEASKDLVDLYKETALNERATRDVAAEQPQQRQTDEQGAPKGASTPPESKSPGKASPKTESILDEPISMPQHYGGTYTTEDLLKLIGKGGRWIAQGANNEGEGRLQNLVPSAFGPTSGTIESSAAWLAEKQPNAMAAINLGRTYIDQARATSEHFQSYSGALGYQPGAGTSLGPFGTANELSLGPFRFRSPLSSGTLAGVKSTAESYWEAMTNPGTSHTQVQAMKIGLGERGWFDGQAPTQEMLQLQKTLHGRGGPLQEISENPEFLDLLDKATRSGTASMSEMLEVFEEIPDVAKAAHVGSQQLLADMKAYGEFAESQGGTSFSGFKQAQAMATATGLPPATSLAMLESPWTASTIFRETGMPSYVQGALPPRVKNEAAIKGFFQAAHTVGNFKPYSVTNPISGAKETVDSISQKAAYMHQFMYQNLSVEQIEKRLRLGSKGAQGRVRAEGALEQWRDDIQGMIERGASPDKISRYMSGGESGQMTGGLGKILTNMLQLKTMRDGEVVPMFSHKDIHDIRAAGKGLHNTDRSKAIYQEAMRVFREKANKQSDNSGSPGSSVMIELSPDAKRWLRLPNRKSRMKAEVNAGGPEPMNHSAVGAQDGLMPQMNNDVYIPGIGSFGG